MAQAVKATMTSEEWARLAKRNTPEPDTSASARASKPPRKEKVTCPECLGVGWITR